MQRHTMTLYPRPASENQLEAPFTHSKQAMCAKDKAAQTFTPAAAGAPI
jgi:hypothetical protein